MGLGFIVEHAQRGNPWRFGIGQRKNGAILKTFLILKRQPDPGWVSTRIPGGAACHNDSPRRARYTSLGRYDEGFAARDYSF